MKKIQTDTEQKIFEAARTIFIQKGMAGARMQEIADEAGINKALLHYYFRTKEKLFDAVFSEAFSHLAPIIISTFHSEKNFCDKICFFVDGYIETLRKNPYIPLFVLSELQKNPTKITSFINNQGIKPELLISQINHDIKKGLIRQVKAEHLMVNIISMCIFPFVASPIIQNLFFKNNLKSYNRFLDERKKEITDFILKSIKKN